MTKPNWRHAVLGLSVLLTTSGCALLHKTSHWAAVRPAKIQAAADMPAVDRNYYGAVAAIERKDYVRALDLLQAARAERADDIRVINAFGVVYDKLGRFDLSARYYAQAKALDSSSVIVASNVAYSQSLQSAAALPLSAQIDDLAPPPAMLTAPVRLAAAGTPVVVTLARPQPGAGGRALFVLTGQPLYIADATGRTTSAEAVRLRLARLGWSAPRLNAYPGAPRARTQIRYPTTAAVAARALWRTLPQGVGLVDCGSACGRIELTLGADALNWTPPVAPPAVRRS